MTTTYLYILQDAESDHVKIGISDDVHRRISQLPDNIDQANSCCVAFSTRKAAHQCEQFIHSRLSQYHKRKPHKGEGSTEWFQAAAKPLAIQFITNNKEFLLCSSDMEPLPVRPLPSEDERAALQARKEAELEARRASRAAQAIEENARVVQQTITALENIRRSGQLVGLAGHIVVLRADTPIEPLVEIYRATLRSPRGISGLLSCLVKTPDAAYIHVSRLYPGDAEAEEMKRHYEPRPALEAFEALLASLPQLPPVQIDYIGRAVRAIINASSEAHHSEPAPQLAW